MSGPSGGDGTGIVLEAEMEPGETEPGPSTIKATPNPGVPHLATEVFAHPPAVLPCSASGYANIANCYNTLVPPPPSLVRSVVAPRPRSGNTGSAADQYANDAALSGITPADYDAGSQEPQILESDSNAITWGGEVFEEPEPAPAVSNGHDGGRNEPGKMQVMPWGRSSIDGRLVLGPATEWGNLSLFVFSPENLDHDLRTLLSDDDKRPFSRRSVLPLAATSDPRTPASCGPGLHHLSCVWPQSIPASSTWHEPSQIYWDLCTTAGSEVAPRTGPDLDTGGARDCTSDENGQVIDGDCYDVSLVMLVGYEWGHEGELTSTDLTVFVPRAKLAPRMESGGLGPQSFKSWPDGVRIYPRMATSALPNYADYQSPHIPADFVTQARQSCPAPGTTLPGSPKWCEFFDHQRHLRPQDITIDGWTTNDLSGPWAAGVHGEQLIEPTTTADGRVIAMNGGAYGVVYAVSTSGNPATACQVDQWTHFSPLSRAPVDPRVNQTYGFARSGVYRDTRNKPIVPGYPISGAYPWIDRKGDNLVFSTGAGRDAYKDVYGDSYFDNKNGKANVIVGAWTRGKLVVPDGALNFTDWGYDLRLANALGYSHRRDLQLYQGDTTAVRPAGTIHMFSMENQLSHIDALTPNMPFDVVWTMSSNTEHNTEIVFDDYLDNRALIVAPMNAPQTTASYVYSSNHAIPGLPPPGNPGTYDDGFTSKLPENGLLDQDNDPAASPPHYEFSRTPRLQNTSTIPHGLGGIAVPPAELELLGGARVEPVALGGVIGKGVYLDGVNDHIRAAFKNPQRTDWYVGLWLDGRDMATPRTVFTFEPQNVTTWADPSPVLYGSWIAASKNEVTVHSAGQHVKVSLAALGLEDERYFHFAIETWMDNSKRQVQVVINGNRVGPLLSFIGGTRTLGAASIGHGPGMDMESWFVVGAPAPVNGLDKALPPSFQGWVDELRVLAVPGSELAGGGYFDEYACNVALGSLALVDAGDVLFPDKTPEKRLGDLAVQYGVVPGQPICEQMVLTSHNYPNDLGLQHGLSLCASRVHKNKDNKRCVREAKLDLTASPVLPQQYLPDFTSTRFCTTCHTDYADPIPGMRPTALDPGSATTGVAHEDRRRRPMQWPRVLTGHLPSVPDTSTPHPPNWVPNEVLDWASLPPFDYVPVVTPPGGGVYYDLVFDGKPRMSPP